MQSEYKLHAHCKQRETHLSSTVRTGLDRNTSVCIYVYVYVYMYMYMMYVFSWCWCWYWCCIVGFCWVGQHEYDNMTISLEYVQQLCPQLFSIHFTSLSWHGASAFDHILDPLEFLRAFNQYLCGFLLVGWFVGFSMLSINMGTGLGPFCQFYWLVLFGCVSVCFGLVCFIAIWILSFLSFIPITSMFYFGCVCFCFCFCFSVCLFCFFCFMVSIIPFFFLSFFYFVSFPFLLLYPYTCQPIYIYNTYQYICSKPNQTKPNQG